MALQVRPRTIILTRSSDGGNNSEGFETLLPTHIRSRGSAKTNTTIIAGNATKLSILELCRNMLCKEDLSSTELNRALTESNPKVNPRVAMRI